MTALQRIDRLIGFESDNAIAVEFGRERIRSVRKIIHLYYLAILAPFAGVAWLRWDHPATRLVGHTGRSTRSSDPPALQLRSNSGPQDRSFPAAVKSC